MPVSAPQPLGSAEPLQSKNINIYSFFGTLFLEVRTCASARVQGGSTRIMISTLSLNIEK